MSNLKRRKPSSKDSRPPIHCIFHMEAISLNKLPGHNKTCRHPAVTERFREIGIRKAIGATNDDIFNQFFCEALIISLTGGVIGIILGVSVTVLVTYLLKFPFVLVWWAIALAVCFSIVVGIAAGVYPALRAAKLQPIDALRYE